MARTDHEREYDRDAISENGDDKNDIGWLVSAIIELCRTIDEAAERFAQGKQDAVG